MSMYRVEKGNKDLIFEEKQEFMVPPTKTPTGFHQPSIFRNAHFLKPIFDPNKTLPKPPSPFPSNNPNIDQLKKFVPFKGRQGPQKNWDTWVNNMQQSHQEIWKKVGIFDAIRASTYNIKRHNKLIIGLADKWCPETNTFVFRFGEATITLEDVFILGGFSVLGECVRTPVRNREFKEIEKDLVKVFPKDARYILHSEWMSHYMGIGGEIEHAALLVLWLTRYVFPMKRGFIYPPVIPIAIYLVRGTRIALAPAVLAAIYRDLGLLKAKIAKFVNNGREDCSVLNLSASFQLVQLWVWERFPILGPEPAVIPRGAPRLARWGNLNKVNVECLRFNFEHIDGVFVWRPYAVSVKNWQSPECYCNEERIVLLNPEDGLELLSFGKCLRNCELVGLDCIEQYLPHRVGMQFGMDQDVPGPVSRMNQSLELAWRNYDEPIVGVMLYLPPKFLKGDVTVQYFDWWTENCINTGEFVTASLNWGQMLVNLSLHLDGSAEDSGSKGACLSSKGNVFAASNYQPLEQGPVNPSLHMDDCNKRAPPSCSSLSNVPVFSGLILCVTDTAFETTLSPSIGHADYWENMAIELFQNADMDDWQATAYNETSYPSDKSTDLNKSHEDISMSTPLAYQGYSFVELLNAMNARVKNCQEWKSSEKAVIEEREELMIDPTSSLANQTPTFRIAYFLKPSLNPSSSLPLFPDIPFALSSKSINVAFTGNLSPAKNWQTWAQKLQQTHEAVWRKAGIFDAIKGSTYHINRNNELIGNLAEKWCPETNTFIFPWGEVTVTLEDVMLLGGFSPLGESVLCNSSVGLKVKRLENMLIEYFGTLKTIKNKMSQYRWMEYFIGLGGDIENAGCLSLWLGRHVFPLKGRAIISRGVLPIAARLSCGIKIALGPAVLASIYRDLTLLKERIVSSSSGCCHRLWLSAPLQLVQVWAWERFPLLGPVPWMIRLGETRLARWSDLCPRYKNINMEMCLDSARETFHWRPYAVSLENWSLPGFYVQSGTWVDVDSDEEWRSFAQCLMVCKFVGLNNCIEVYNPHRVALQFGFDQDIPNPIFTDNTSDLQGLRLYLPSRLRKGDVTYRYCNWWRTGIYSLPGEAPMCSKRRKGTLRNTEKMFKIRQSNSYSECTQSNCEAKSMTEPLREPEIRMFPCILAEADKYEVEDHDAEMARLSDMFIRKKQLNRVVTYQCSSASVNEITRSEYSPGHQYLANEVWKVREMCSLDTGTNEHNQKTNTVNLFYEFLNEASTETNGTTAGVSPAMKTLSLF